MSVADDMKQFIEVERSKFFVQGGRNALKRCRTLIKLSQTKILCFVDQSVF